MPEKGNWSEKDEIAIHALIVNLLNQSTMFQDIGTNTIMPSSFGITNSKEYTLGLFTGIVINLFANYWVGEHEAGLTKEELCYLYQKISDFREEILSGLFD
jgi:hypothetical protein